jgi:hypothetical protein
VNNHGWFVAVCVLQATSELDGHLRASGQHRQHVAAVQQAEREARTALQHQQASAAQHSQQVGLREGAIKGARRLWAAVMRCISKAVALSSSAA